MELRHPLILLLIPLIIIAYIVINYKRKNNYFGGSKIANTGYIKSSPYYKKKIRAYKLFLFIAKTLCFASIIISIIMLARPARIETKKINEYNRDIFICMDVSLSVNDLNKELVDELKKLVKELDGERIGISIFNTSSVTIVPLTDDYEYLEDVLDQLKKSFNSLAGNNYTSDDYLYNVYYLLSGTLEDNEEKGSSLIGDGLASCVFSFSNLDEKERTRIIIFTTDNDLAGTPTLTLDEAATISKKKKIVVYGISPKDITTKNKKEYKDAILKTNGKYYDFANLKIKTIVDDINKTSKTLLDTKKETKEFDIPEMPFIFLLSSVILLFIINRKVV